jgi:hypothetical protein
MGLRNGLIGVTSLVAMAAFHSVASAVTSTITVQATRAAGPPPTTTFQLHVCICMTAAEIQGWIAAGGGPVGITLGGACEVTENDFWDDDELGPSGGTVGGGGWAVPFPFTPMPCPPNAPTCLLFGPVIGPVPDSSYGSENPADFQLGETGSGEGVVPAGTSVNVPGCPASTPSMPNTSS